MTQGGNRGGYTRRTERGKREVVCQVTLGGRRDGATRRWSELCASQCVESLEYRSCPWRRLYVSNHRNAHQHHAMNQGVETGHRQSEQAFPAKRQPSVSPISPRVWKSTCHNCEGVVGAARMAWNAQWQRIHPTQGSRRRGWAKARKAHHGSRKRDRARGHCDSSGHLGIINFEDYVHKVDKDVKSKSTKIMLIKS